MSMNEEKIIEAISMINDTIFESMTDSEKLVVMANLILTLSTNHFPNDLKKDKHSVASNGKSVAYELMKHVSDDGLNLAMKAHHIIDIANRIDNGTSN